MEQLGINPVLLVTQIINFLIVMVALNFLLFKPLLGMLSDRKSQIEKGLQITEQMESEKEKLDVKKKKILKEAQDEGQRIISAAIAEAKKEEEKLVAEAKKAASQEITKMRSLMEKERDSILEEARSEAVRYAIAISEKILGEKIGKTEQDRLVKQSISRL